MRPFIEFIHSQRVPATTDVLPGPRRVLATKTLSRDDTTRECTTIVTYERGASFDETRFGGFDEEIFVLTGELETSFGTLGRHGYAYWPAGTPRKISTRKGAVVLTCLNLDPKATPDGYRKEGLVRGHDSIAQPWDRTNMDPKIAHLAPWRKNLRLSPDGTMRTYLLGGLPHGIPQDKELSVERHPVLVEEMFMVFGDIHCPLGIMRAGSYFWRPPNEWHGPHYSLSGFLIFMRTPGSNVISTEWSEKKEPITLAPPHKPILPPELREIGAAPLDDPIVY